MAPAANTPTPGDGAAAPPSLAPRGQGRYRNLLRLGRGGMGTVDLAVEQSTDDGPHRVVALKRLLPEVCDERHADMFLREARLGALLRHKNVVQALDFGELDGEPFLAMEYVEGQTLSEVIAALKERGRLLKVPLLSHVLREVCAGLHAAHELKDVSGKSLGVVHRDVSPHNIVISYSGDVKVLDFGVAKIDRDSTTTRTGEVKGKMAYMSPEQAMGEPLDRRSDFFALGAVLYECVAGARMWGEGTDMDIMRRFALGAPPKLSAIDADLPAHLVQLHERLTAVRREDRPDSAASIAKEFGAMASDTAKHELAALMTELFDERAQAQRAALEAALAALLPKQEAARLRESLVPPAAAVPTPTASSTGVRTALIVLAAVVVGAGATMVLRGSPAQDMPRSAPASSASGAVSPPSVQGDAPTPSASTAAMLGSPSANAPEPGAVLATTARQSPPKPTVTASGSKPIGVSTGAERGPKAAPSAAPPRPIASAGRLNVDPEPF